MPCAWAGEKVVPPFEVPQEFEAAWQHVQQGTDSKSLLPHPSNPDLDYYRSYTYPNDVPIKNKPPLSKLRIESEDWFEGNTYYIRYTITNPTNELIEGDVDYFMIGYLLYSKKEESVLKERYSDIIPQISIPPHSSRSFVIPLTINEPFDYIHFKYSTFYFTDDSYLSYELEYDRELPNVLVAPIILPSGEVYLAMKNHHFFKTITDIRNIELTASFTKTSTDRWQKPVKFKYIDAAPLSVHLKPKETAFFRLPQSFELNDDLSFSIAYMDITINGIKHKFAVDTNPAYTYTATKYTKHYAWYYTPSIFETFGINQIEASGTYEMDDTTLYGYLRIKNPHDKTLSYPFLLAYTSLTYCKPDNAFGGVLYRFLLPTPLTLAPNEENFFSFSIPLPQDILKTPRLRDFYLVGDKYVYYGVKFTPKNISALQKILYTPVTETKLIFSH